MSREKQIEEMARDICRVKQSCNDVCHPINSCRALKYAERFYTAGYRKQEWISIDERLPKELTHVIVCDEDGTVGEAFCYKEGRFEWVDSEEIVFVTHWMPLPEAPNMNAGAK